MANQEYGLGRRPSAPDERDLSYPIRAVLPKKLKPLRSRAWGVPVRHRLNQGGDGICVGASSKHYLMARPLSQTRPPEAPTMFDIYADACRLDVWPENDPGPQRPYGDLEFGTSIRAAAKALQARGLISTYHWITTTSEASLDLIAWDAALSWLCNDGPLLFGIDWYDEFFDPGPGALLTLNKNARPVGMHAILADGYDKPKRRVRLLNSWGLGWGASGYCWIRDDDLLYLTARPYAEGLVARETKP